MKKSNRLPLPVTLYALGLWFLESHSLKLEDSEEEREKEWHKDHHDQVEEASWESFPASDPPGWRS